MMSGGSLDYACYKINDIEGAIRAKARTPLHRAFADHLAKVAKAVHHLEWVLSGDYSEGDEVSAIEAVVSPADVLETVLKEAMEAEASLRDAIEKANASATSQPANVSSSQPVDAINETP